VAAQAKSAAIGCGEQKGGARLRHGRMRKEPHWAGVLRPQPPIAPPPTFSHTLSLVLRINAVSHLIATRALPNPRPLQVQRVSLNLDKAIDCVLSLDKATPDPNPSGSEREADPIQYCHLADGASPLSLQR